MTNRTVPHPTLSAPEGWSRLTWKELVWMYEHGTRGDGEEEMMWRFRVWMQLCGVEMFGKSYFQDGGSQQPYLDKDDIGVDELRAMADCISGKPMDPNKEEGPTLACLFRYRATWWKRINSWLSGIRNPPMGATLVNLYEAIKAQMTWLDDPVGLTEIPKDSIWIGNRKYKIPDNLLINLTYGQYSDCQHALQSYWSAMQVLTWDEKEEAQKKRSRKKPSEEQIEYATKLLLESQAMFTASILTPRRFQLFDTKDGLRIHLGYVWVYDSGEAQELSKKIGTRLYVRNSILGSKVNMIALFGILYRQFQSCVQEFYKMYPNLFSGGGGENDDHPLTVEIGTLNAIMKYAGFCKSEDVYESNAVVIFKWLDSMTKEAKEMEKITKKS